MDPTSVVSRCTLRIAGLSAGKPVSVGTGFLYGFPLDSDEKMDGQFFPVLITNKHVLNGCDQVEIAFSVAAHDCENDAFGMPLTQQVHTYTLPIQQTRVDQPDAAIDLCGLTVAAAVNDLAAKQLRLAHCYLSKSYQLDADRRSYPKAIEKSHTNDRKCRMAGD